MQEIPVRFLGWEDPLEKGQATHSSILGLPWWFSWSRICLQCRRPGFDPWVGKIPWRRERLPTPVFWPRESHGLYSPWGHKESDTTEQLSLSPQLEKTHMQQQSLNRTKNRYIFFICFPLFFCQLEANYSTILQWVLPYIDMNQPWIYMCYPS